MLYGYFKSVAYPLSVDNWFISKDLKIDFNNGNYFIFNTPDYNIQRSFNNMINKNSYQIIKPTQNGTYSLTSNQLIISFVKLCIVFMFIIFLFISWNWKKKLSPFVTAWNLTGYKMRHIYSILLIYKFVPFVLASSVSILLLLWIQYVYALTWGIDWIIYFIFFIIAEAALLICFDISPLLFHFLKKRS
jgi:sensor histidine kinase YesM